MYKNPQSNNNRESVTLIKYSHEYKYEYFHKIPL